MAAISSDTVICVQGKWDDWKTAEVRLRNLQDVHWSQPTGAPRPLAHGYILCSDIIIGEVAHACDGGALPHRLRVCVLKRHSAPTIYAEIARRADVRQQAEQTPMALPA
jgi:hypothetical protein